LVRFHYPLSISIFNSRRIHFYHLLLFPGDVRGDDHPNRRIASSWNPLPKEQQQQQQQQQQEQPQTSEEHKSSSRQDI
jgi:hypothetical protein